MKIKIAKTIRQYLWLTGMFNFGVSMSLATYVTFLISKGLNLFEVNLINVVFFLTMFFWEIPTGAFADTFGRKKSYVISCFLFSIGEIVYSQSTNFSGFIFAEMLAGIGRTFANGAYHAWFIDTLKHHGFEGSTDSLFKKEKLVHLFVGVPGAMIGAYIGSYDLAYPWLLGGCIGIISGTVALVTMKEEYFSARKISLRESFREMFAIAKTSIVFAKGSGVVKFIIGMNVLLAFSTQAPNMQWQPFFGEKLRDTSHYGYIWMGISLMVFVGIIISLKIKRKLSNERNALLFCVVTAGLGMMGAASIKNYFFMSLCLFLLHEIPRGAYGPIKDAYLNDNINPRERATVISCQSTFSHLACLLGLFTSGLIANTYSISTAWIVSGLVIVLIPLWFIKGTKNHQIEPVLAKV